MMGGSIMPEGGAGVTILRAPLRPPLMVPLRSPAWSGWDPFSRCTPTRPPTGSPCTADGTCTSTGRRRSSWVGWRSTAGATPRSTPMRPIAEPLTLDDYFSARMISDPFGLFDCDVPIDGSIALVVSAPGLRRRLQEPGRPGRGIRGRLGRGELGSAARLPEDGLGGGRRRNVESHRPHAARHRCRRALRRLHVPHASPGSKPSGSAATVSRVPSSKAGPGSRWRENFPSTPTAASCRPAACTATGSSTRPCSSCAITPGHAKWPMPRWRWPSVGGGPIAGCMLLTR